MFLLFNDGLADFLRKSNGIKGLSNELMQLRKICQHPFLFESVEDKISPGGYIDEKLVRTSGKIELLHRILPKFFATGHRVLIFFQMTKVMDIMEDFLKMMGWKHLRLDGNTKTEERASFVQMFNAKDSEYTVFILSTRAGGLGLNLQTADTVIMYALFFLFREIIDHCLVSILTGTLMRICKLKIVPIVSDKQRLCLSFDSSLRRALRKRCINAPGISLILMIKSSKLVVSTTNLRKRSKKSFWYVVRASHILLLLTRITQRSILEADQEEENEEAGDMNDDELNELIARHESEVAIFREMDAKRERDALENWRNAGNKGRPPPPLMQFEELPECYQADEPFEIKEVDDVVEGRGARRRNVVSYNDGLDDDTWAMALEDGEDLQELSEQTRSRKDRRNKVKESEISARGTPVSEVGEARGRKSKKGKGRADEYAPIGSKRKRGTKAHSLTPEGDEEEEDPDPVLELHFLS